MDEIGSRGSGSKKESEQFSQMRRTIYKIERLLYVSLRKPSDR